MRALIKGLFASFFLFLSCALAAQTPSTLYYQTYLDLDGNTGTGCTVTVPDNLSNPQTLSGVEASLVLTVTNGVLTSAERFACVSGSMISQGVDSGHPSYTLGGAFIEYRLPNVAITPQTTAGFAASASPSFTTPSDVFFTSGGLPIPLGPLLQATPGVPIPVSTPILLLLIAAAAGLVAARYLRTPHGRRLAVFAFFICLASLSGAVYSAVNILLDGNDNDWTGVSALATDPEGDAPYPEIDLTKAYGVYQGSTLYLKLDLKQKPANNVTPPQPQSDFRLLGASVTEPDSQSQVVASGTASQIRGTATKVKIKNIRTGETITASLSGNAWQGQLEAKAKDLLELTPIAADNTEGGAIQIAVQGTATEPLLPPDPINDNSVAPKLDPLLPYTLYDSTQFLYTNNPPIQTGVDPDTIKPKLAALLVGKVLDRNDQPLSGVTVHVKDHGQYGQTLTRTDGQWDLVVNGGQWFTVEYKKDGFLPVQRKVQVAWQDYGYLPDVVLIPLDQQVSTVDLRETGADAPAFQVHQGSISTDADGPRQATVLFPKGTTAQMELPDGSTQNLDVLNVRATEYTIGANGPNAMPGELPPATGYTYAVELSVDQAISAGAKQVNFSQPLPMYVDNFLDFPVGEIVPLGWYSYDKKAWVPDENGYVIKVLSTNNGIATLDVKGQGSAATPIELANLGITQDELKAIAQLYQPGKTFWRVTVSHFTPWDCNVPWGAPPCESGTSCEPPEQEKEKPDDTDTPPPPPECSSTAKGCTIQAQSRTMSETLPITGTPFSLDYSTARTPGYSEGFPFSQRYLRDSRPLQAEVFQIWSKAQILGRNISVSSASSSAVAASQTDKFQWDGRDRYSRTLYRTSAKVKHVVGYEVKLVYYAAPADRGSSFAQYSNTVQVIGNRIATTLSLSNTFEKMLIAPTQMPSIAVLRDDLGLWTIGAHHHYDPVRRLLEKGTGTRRTQTGIELQLDYVASSLSGNSFTVLPDGRVLIARPCYSVGCTAELFEVGSNGGSTPWPLPNPQGGSSSFSIIRYDDIDGGLYLVDNKNRIFYRAPDGNVTWIAGKESGTVAGNDEYEPLDTRFGSIGDVVRGHDGILYISDSSAYCVRKLDADGKIRTVAGICRQWGNRTQPWPGSAPAAQTKLSSPRGLALDASGVLYIADTDMWRVFKITSDGLIHSHIGRGYEDGCSREEKESPDEICITPTALALSTNGDLYITGASGSEYIYKRDTDGKMSIVAGNFEYLYGEPSYYGPGNAPDASYNPATTAISVGALVVDGEGALLFKDYTGSLRRMRQALPGFDGGDILIPESDGRQAYLFNARGRHLKTLDTLTGAVLYTFHYDGNGILTGIADFDGGVTQIGRSGNTITITAPYGQQTKLTLQNGELVEVTDPAGAAWKFEYDEGGLMVKATNPNNQSNVYTYDVHKRLLSDLWPNGGGWTMEDVFTPSNNWRTTKLVSGEGRAHSYGSYDNQPKGIKTTVNPDGSTSGSNASYYGRTSTSASGNLYLMSQSSAAGDPRFGMMASYTSSSTDSFKNNPISYSRLSTTSRKRFTELNASGQIFPVKRWGEEQWFNSPNPSSQVYDHDEGLWTTTSESGRVTKTWVDALHRPLKVEALGVPTLLYTYNLGKITQIEVKPSTGASRISKNEYDARGNLKKSIDPLNRAASYEYDTVGRLIKQTLPDGRFVQQKYDAMGNLTELTTPAGEKHLFSFDVMGDKAGYTPPAISGTTTSHYYNKDRQPTKTILPGGSELTWAYDQSSGRLTQSAYSEGTRALAYDSALRPGSLREGTNTLYFLYDGVHQSGQSWDGDVKGIFRTYHDSNGYYNKGLITRLEATATNPAALRQKFTYGSDDEVTALSLMKVNQYSQWQEDRKITFERDADTLRLNKVNGWNAKDRDERTYNAFGELTGYRYHQLRQYGSTLDDAQVTLSGNEVPVDFLKVEGALILDGNYAGLDKLWLAAEKKAAEGPFADQWFAVGADGLITGRTLGLEGAPDVARDLTVSVGKAGLTWNRTVGKLTKQARATSPVKELSAIDAGVAPKLYTVEQRYEDTPPYNTYYEVTRLDPATAQIEIFRAQAQTTGWNASVAPIGAYDGQIYLRHSGSWDCGMDSYGQPYDCITRQKEGSAELLFPIPGWHGEAADPEPGEPPATLMETHHIRQVTGRQDQFHIVREVTRQGVLTRQPVTKTGQPKAQSENRLDIERWDTQGNKQPVAQIEKNANENLQNLVSAGEDLLIHLRGNASRLLRVKPDGSYREIPLETGVDLLSLFGDQEATCHTLRKPQNYSNPQPDEIVCQDETGQEVQRSVLPPRGEPWSQTAHSPQMNPATRTLYLVLPSGDYSYSNQTYTLWHLKKPAGPDSGLWQTAFEAEPLKTATLTIGGSLDGINDGGYRIDVERDLIGRITAKEETLEGDKTKQSYQYDPAGRLVEIKTGENGESTETWGYDANGNRTHHNGTQIATFDPQDRILTQDGTSYEHNPMGQRTKKQGPGGTTTYRYDNLGNLREANVNGTNIVYAIDPQDRRVGRKQNGSWTHKWIYQDGLNPIAELDDQDRIRKAFVYADKGHVPSYMLTFDENGAETGQYRIVSDLLGSVRVVYDLTTGYLVQQIDYDVWGNITNDTNPDFQPFGFAGGLYDQTTKLTRFGERDYDAETGRWAAKDPIYFRGGDINLYGYVLNDPVNFIDPEGLAPGDKFQSISDVLGDIKKTLPVQRNYKYVEYGGWIYKEEDCYSYSLRSDNSPISVQITGANVPKNPVATWHTHPSYGDGGNNQFSSDDKPNAEKRGVPSYLIAPNGTIRSYDPKTGRDTMASASTSPAPCSCSK